MYYVVSYLDRKQRASLSLSYSDTLTMIVSVYIYLKLRIVLVCVVQIFVVSRIQVSVSQFRQTLSFRRNQFILYAHAAAPVHDTVYHW